MKSLLIFFCLLPIQFLCSQPNEYFKEWFDQKKQIKKLGIKKIDKIGKRGGNIQCFFDRHGNLIQLSRPSGKGRTIKHFFSWVENSTEFERTDLEIMRYPNNSYPIDSIFYHWKFVWNEDKTELTEQCFYQKEDYKFGELYGEYFKKFDKKGKLIEKEIPMQGKECYEYYSNGNLKKKEIYEYDFYKKHFKFKEDVYYFYDSKNQLIETITDFPNQSSNISKTNFYIYNKKGQLVFLQDKRRSQRTKLISCIHCPNDDNNKNKIYERGKVIKTFRYNEYSMLVQEIGIRKAFTYQYLYFFD